MQNEERGISDVDQFKLFIRTNIKGFEQRTMTILEYYNITTMYNFNDDIS